MAKDILRGNYKEHGIYAGKRHFDDYWARDAFFASIASLALNDLDIVKKNLELFIRFQKKNGQLPFRVGKYNILLKILGIKIGKEIKPRYKEDKNISLPLDQNLLFVIITSYYILKTRDKDFAKKYFKSLRKSIEWVSKYRKDFLLYERPYSGWEDSLNIKGYTIYNNVLYHEALKVFSFICKIINENRSANIFFKRAEEVKKKINWQFWNGEYYCSFVNKKKHNYFSTTGNLLAIYFGVADKSQAKKIEKNIDKFGINEYVPSLTNFPKYPKIFIFTPFSLIGLSDYHNGLCWLWLGCLNVITKARTGLKKEAMKLLYKISNIIIKYGGIYEIYEQSGKPVKRFLYKSEEDFSWAASFFILAYKEVHQ